jgi:hypothetical protein
MATDIRPLNSSFLSGSLCDDSRSLFDQWTKHLEFQYDFVKVSAFRMVRSPNRESFKKMIVTEMRWTDWRRKSVVFENFMPLAGEISDIALNFFGRTTSLDLLKANKSFRK